jgi:DNA-binding CsgD family transcriptional regulator
MNAENLDAAPVSLWAGLTAREMEIALMLGNGNTNREIAKALNISIKTVDTHRGHLLKKLECRNNVALVRYLIRESRVTP